MLSELKAVVTSLELEKILQITEFLGNAKTIPYKGTYVNVKGNLGLLCTWFECTDKVHFTISNELDVKYYQTNTYLCIRITKHCVSPENPLKSC